MTSSHLRAIAQAHRRRSWSACSSFATLAAALLAMGGAAAASRHPLPSPDAREADLAAARADAERRQALTSADGSDFKYDYSPPVLRNIRVTGSVDAQMPNQSVDVSVKLTDDYSGVVYFSAYFVSPSGHSLNVGKSLPVPANLVSATVKGGPYVGGNAFSTFSEPGVWRAVDFYTYDAHGNYLILSESELAQLGKPSFTVTNTGGYDATAPGLSSGELMSGNVKLSKPPRGTSPGVGPYVGAALNLTDAGNGAVAGVYAVTVGMCLPDGQGDCLDSFVMTGTANGPGQTAATLHAGGQLFPDQMPGTYKIEYVYVRDYAGNSLYLRGQGFVNGDTDFRTYFPATSIKVVP